MDVNRRYSDKWIIDFGQSMTETEAAMYEFPFQHVISNCKPHRMGNRNKKLELMWWTFESTRPDLRKAISKLSRFIVTSMVSKHRFFIWLPICLIPENLCVAIASADDTTFGILHSRFHVLWSIAQGSTLEDRSVYNSIRCFQTFPFPPNVLHHPDSDSQYPAIAQAAKRLNELRENWLNPPEWVDRVPEIFPGYPDRIIAKPGHETDLKQRTLTNLYNQRPAWLANVHKTLDQAVAVAYGWTDYTDTMPDEEILKRLLALNLSV